jgi:hypothetical protein
MSHKKYRAETNCLNCGAQVLGRFCQNCGQENIETKENFFHMVTHVIGDFFHFDSKFFRSLKPLFIKPGFLTKEYWEGKRMHYIHPLRLFFFVTIVMVIIASAYYKKFEQQIKKEKVVTTSGSTGNVSEEERRETEKVRTKIVSSVDKTFDYMSAYLKYISFLLLPVYALGFKLLYIRSKRYYIDHLVYTLHVQSFAYIIVSLMLLIPLFISPAARDWFMKAMLWITAVYILLSLKYVYRQSWVKTIVKSFLAMGYILFVTVIFITLIMVINIALYK